MFKRLLYPFLGLRFRQFLAANAFRLEDVGSRIVNRLEDSQYLREVHGALTNCCEVPRIEYSIVVFQMGAGNVRGNFLKFYDGITAVSVEGDIARIEVDPDGRVVHRTYQL